MPHRGIVPIMPKKPHVSLRINCPLPLYEKIGEYRHAARHETRGQAMITLLAAGLAALAKPPALPSAGKTVAADTPVLPVAEPVRTNRGKSLVPFAGRDRSEAHSAEWRNR